jgi:SRSO17 transposase
VLDDHAWARLRRLMRWLDQFKSCFGHRAQVVSLTQYVHGLLGDSARKSMHAMLARVTEPVSYQAFQHFITHAPWDVAPVWRRLLEVLPERRGVLVLDDTGFPKQGTASVGVARQYSGTLGKIANCQVAVTAALWTGVRAWLLGAELYLPAAWLSPEGRQQARIPRRVRFQEKWRLALTLLRRARAAGLHLDLVVADAGYGDAEPFRTALDRLRLPYLVGVSSTVTVWPGTPRIVAPSPTSRGGRPRTHAAIAPEAVSSRVAAWAAQQPLGAWRRVSWRHGSNRPWGGAVCRDARHAGRPVAPQAAAAGGLAALSAPARGDQRLEIRQVLPQHAACHDQPAGAGPRGASALGHRATIPRPEDRARFRSFRGAVVSWLVAPRRDHGCRVRVLADGAAASSRGPAFHVPADSGNRAGSVYGPALCQSAPVHAMDASSGTPLSPVTDLTK